jgi:hypothetical protein
MKLFFVLLVILLILFIPFPIKLSIYYSSVDYYVKVYKLTLFSKKKHGIKRKHIKRNKPLIKKEHKFFHQFYERINFRFLILNLQNLNLKLKPLLRIKLSLDYSLNDAARTAIFYGVLCQAPPLIYILLSKPFKINRYNFKINPRFENNFLLKFESSSIIFLSFANIIYITIILFRLIIKQGR